METQKVGIREFRDKLSTYLLESEAPMAITRHGDTVGYYIPARRKRTDADRLRLEQAASLVQKEMERVGLTEEQAMADYEQLRAEHRAQRRKQ